MNYVLKKSKFKKGLYLQIYESHYDPKTQTKKNHCYQTFGYYDDMVAQGIKDPILHIRKIIEELNGPKEKISQKSQRANLGYFVIKSVFDLLDLDDDIAIYSSPRINDFNVAELIRSLTYSYITSAPLFLAKEFTFEQLQVGKEYLEDNFQEFIEILNHGISHIFPRDASINYLLELDDQLILCDTNQIPIAAGGNGDIPSIIQKLKVRFDITGETILIGWHTAPQKMPYILLSQTQEDDKAQVDCNEKKILIKELNLTIRTSQVDMLDSEIYAQVSNYLTTLNYLAETKEDYPAIISYYAITILKLIQHYGLQNEVDLESIIDFIDSFTLSIGVNHAIKTPTLTLIQQKFNLPMLDNLYLTSKDVEKIINAKFPCKK